MSSQNLLELLRLSAWSSDLSLCNTESQEGCLLFVPFPGHQEGEKILLELTSIIHLPVMEGYFQRSLKYTHTITQKVRLDICLFTLYFLANIAGLMKSALGKDRFPFLFLIAFQQIQRCCFFFAKAPSYSTQVLSQKLLLNETVVWRKEISLVPTC